MKINEFENTNLRFGVIFEALFQSFPVIKHMYAKINAVGKQRTQ